MIETDRLILRAYREADRDDFAALNGDPRVGAWLAGTLDRERSDALMDRINGHIAEHGFGYWGAERKADGKLIGFVGLTTVKAGEMPCGEAIEMGWRLIPETWGQGLASEGAAAALAWAFANLSPKLPNDEIVAFTTVTNLASQGVMRKIGMVRDPARDFDHPRLAADHPLLKHVLYSARRSGN